MDCVVGLLSGCHVELINRIIWFRGLFVLASGWLFFYCLFVCYLLLYSYYYLIIIYCESNCYFFVIFILFMSISECMYFKQSIQYLYIN